MTDKKTNSKKNEQGQPPIVVTRQANFHGEAAVRVAVVVPWSEQPPKRIQERKGDGAREVLFEVTVPVSDWVRLLNALNAAASMLGLHTAIASKKSRVTRQATPRVADAQQKHEEPRGSTPQPRSGARKRRVDAGGES